MYQYPTCPFQLECYEASHKTLSHFKTCFSKHPLVFEQDINIKLLNAILNWTHHKTLKNIECNNNNNNKTPGESALAE